MKAPTNPDIERLLSDPAVRAQFDARHCEEQLVPGGERMIRLTLKNGVVVLRSSPVKVP